MTSPGDGRIPLTIVTGFLGSGKTTLIRSLLAAQHFANAAIIVNEFGEVGIDHHLFRKTDERITLLSGGCACCARRDDLVEALLDLLRRFDREEVSFDHVLLETSGLADPAPIRHTIIADPVLSRRYRVAQTIVTLDAVAGATNLATYGEAMRQITSADAVVITKRDLANEAAVSALTHRVAESTRSPKSCWPITDTSISTGSCMRASIYLHTIATMTSSTTHRPIMTPRTPSNPSL